MRAPAQARQPVHATDSEAGANARAADARVDALVVVQSFSARATERFVSLSRRAGEQGYLNVISDGGVGVLAGFTGLRSAALNVYINAPALKDRAFAETAIGELEKLVEFCAAESEAVYKIVRDKLG